MPPSTTTDPRLRPIRRRVLAVAGALAFGIVVTGCTGGYFGPVDGSGSGSESGSADRRAGDITRGTAVCVRNESSDRLEIAITGAQDDQAEFADTDGSELLGIGWTRCMKSDSLTAGGTATARITIASGEVFRVQGFNPPWDPAWLAVNGDARELAVVGGTTDFKIGKHPLRGERLTDTSHYVQFRLTIT